MVYVVAAAVIAGGAAIHTSTQARKSAKSAAAKVAAAQEGATDASLTAQQEQLNYLKDVDELPRQFREQALTQLGEVYLGAEGFQYPEGQLLDQAKNSEMFSMLREQGEEAVLRGASATGGLRSGSASEALADNTQRALMSSYAEQQKQYEMGLQGVASLANLPLQTANISNVMGSMGQTQAAGILGVGQAQAQGDLAAAQAQQQGITQASAALGSGIAAFAQLPSTTAPAVQQPTPGGSAYFQKPGQYTTGLDYFNSP